MNRKRLLRTLAMFAVSTVALLSSHPEVEARATTMEICDQVIPSYTCNPEDEEETMTVCSAFCPSWLVAICFENGNLKCITDAN